MWRQVLPYCLPAESPLPVPWHCSWTLRLFLFSWFELGSANRGPWRKMVNLREAEKTFLVFVISVWRQAHWHPMSPGSARCLPDFVVVSGLQKVPSWSEQWVADFFSPSSSPWKSMSHPQWEFPSVSSVVAIYLSPRCVLIFCVMNLLCNEWPHT